MLSASQMLVELLMQFAMDFCIYFVGNKEGIKIIQIYFKIEVNYSEVPILN